MFGNIYIDYTFAGILGLVSVAYLIEVFGRIKKSINDDPEKVEKQAEKMSSCRKEIFDKINNLEKQKADEEFVKELDKKIQDQNSLIAEIKIGQAQQNGKIDLILEKINNFTR